MDSRSVPPLSPRQVAARRRRRVIVNNDGHDATRLPGPYSPQMVLEQRTAALAGSHVDAIFYCTGVVNLYTHRSTVSEFRGTKPGMEFAQALVDQGTDTLTVMTDFGHRHGMEVYWSMRMNDTHDYGMPDRLTEWKKANPHLLMGKHGDKIPWRTQGDWDARWSSLDYGQAEVREKIFRILEDVCTRYDVDGVELDFFRHPLYFRAQYRGDDVTQAECDLMTDLVRRIHCMTEMVAARRGRPLLIAARVPDSLGYAKAIGLDVARWLDEKLVDLLIGTCYFQLEPWENFAAVGKRYGVPVYACLSASRFVSPSDSRVSLPLDRWYGESLAAWDAGVDGIYIFNVFDPRDPRFRQLGDPSLLRAMNPVYEFTAGSPWVADYWLKNGNRFRVGHTVPAYE